MIDIKQLFCYIGNYSEQVFGMANRRVLVLDPHGPASQYRRAVELASECNITYSTLTPELDAEHVPFVPDVLVFNTIGNVRTYKNVILALTNDQRYAKVPYILVVPPRQRKAAQRLARGPKKVVLTTPITGMQLANTIRGLLALPHRRHNRRRCQLMVRLYDTEDYQDLPIRARTGDVSSSGMFATTDHPFSVGQSLRVIMNFAGAKEPLELMGVVRREASPREGRPGYGIEFQSHLYGDDMAFRETLGVPLAV